MTSTDLFNTLQLQYTSGGSMDVSLLGDPSYTAVFGQMGIPSLVLLSGSSGWENNTSAQTVTFNGQIQTSVLGLTVPGDVIITFSPVNEAPGAFGLAMELRLAQGWTFSQSFPIVSGRTFDSIQLADAAANKSVLTVTASSQVTSDPDNNPPLYFDGYIDPNSSVFALLARFISGDELDHVHGRIDYSAATGTAFMRLPLATGSLNDLFGSSGPQFTFGIFLYGGINTAINWYESGVLFETDFILGGTRVPLLALYSDVSGNTLNLQISAISIDFDAVIASIGQLFGSQSQILSKIPQSISSASLTLSGIGFNVSLDSLTLNSAWMGISMFDQPWEVWPGVLTLSDVTFSASVTDPFGAHTTTLLQVSAVTTFGGENGIPLALSGSLPELQLRGKLNADEYNLKPLIEYVFNSDKGLPEDLVISELYFSCDVAGAVYSFDLDVTGDWEIDFNENNALSFRELRVEMGYDNELGPTGTLFCEFTINTSTFDVELDLSAENVRLTGEWIDQENPIDYIDIAIILGMYGLPDLPQGIDLNLTEAFFELETAGPSISFELTSASYGSAALVAGRDGEGNWGFIFGMIAALDLSLNLTDIDVIGNFVPEGMDVISVNNLRFVGATPSIPLYTSQGVLDNVFGPEVNSGLVLSIDLNIGTLFSETFTVRIGGLNDGTSTDTPPPTNTGGTTNNNPPPPAPVTPSPVPAALPGPTSAWIDVQRSFGPVHIARIGFRITEDNSLGILLDAGVNLAGLTIGLSGLEADIPLNAPFWPSFALAGLEVGYVSPGLTLAGALIKAYGVTPTMYTGELILQAGSFGATAFGSYTTVNNEPSLFAFLALNVPLGGPPFCVVTGLSLGFGYNRRLILPTIETVQTYPLVQAAMGITDPQETINALNQYIVPADNQYWLAAGIRFTSFEMLNAYALLTASFGTQVELALMGEAVLTLPLVVPGKEELILAQADMVLLASINPSLGQMSISAQLTSRSFILDRNAQITGGFAFYFWFGNNTHAGDFVVTLGGYNPYFTTPTYYPRVPLLGLNWQISSLISIKGGLYCALTPSVIMAGGNLSASYTSGNVKAWFNANADFLMRFKPFSFESTIGVSVGASYKINLYFTTKTVSVTVGASLKLWGPPFAGTATVDLTVMSFTIAFGAPKQKVSTTIDWTEFRNSFLPPEPLSPLQHHQSGYTRSLIRFNADRGMIGTEPEAQLEESGYYLEDGETAWQMDPDKTLLSITSAIPSTAFTTSMTTVQTNELSSLNTHFGVGPMGVTAGDVISTLNVTIKRNGNNDTDNTWYVKLLKENVPAGLWLNTTNSMNGDAVVKNVFTGIQLHPKSTRPDVMAPLSLDELLHYSIPVRTASWSDVVPPNADYFSQGMQAFQSSLNSPTAIAGRNPVLDVLAAQGLSTYGAEEIELDGYVTDAQNLLYAAPRICYLGETSNTSS
jgi:hypothetical protein